MLVKRSTSTDCYYIIQLVELNDTEEQYGIYFRWGRLWTAGQCQTLYPNSLDEALDLFEDKFFEKTGVEWAERTKYRSSSDLYQWIQPKVKKVKETIEDKQEQEGNREKQITEVKEIVQDQNGYIKQNGNEQKNEYNQNENQQVNREEII
eukprot:TRINITY_DN6560_c0_g1_i11.p2 TRINITY_DN6560_c0_g1~~TRINITY_DN6560_c0_g1_i11.p2  ORF type:complete len:150 (-),score=20.32 TRINITY_DN6560_c0_g1_i11:100-549(-)